MMFDILFLLSEPPSFVKPMEDKEIMAGGSIVLECMASGSPRPKLSWRKNGSPLQTTERHFFTAEDQLFIIVNTIASDAGSYECEMSNSLGSVVDATELTINPGKIAYGFDFPYSLIDSFFKNIYLIILFYYSFIALQFIIFKK